MRGFCGKDEFLQLLRAYLGVAHQLEGKGCYILMKRKVMFIIFENQFAKLQLTRHSFKLSTELNSSETGVVTIS